ncbi:MAG: ATP-binding protein [Patescibacteria group bacterium]
MDASSPAPVENLLIDAQMILSAMGDAVILINKDQTIAMMNPQAEKLLEVRFADIQGKKWNEVTVAYNLNGVPILSGERSITRCFTTGETAYTTVDDEHYYKTKSGRLFPISSSTAPLRKDDQIIGAVKVFRDASRESKYRLAIAQQMGQQTEDIKVEQLKLLSSITNLPIGFIIADANDKVLISNPAAQKIMDSYVIPDSVSSINSALGQQLQHMCDVCKKDQKSLTVKDYTFNNKFLKLLAAPIILYESNGNYVGTAMLLEDETEQKVLERSKDEFFSIASHELRTPLTAIRGNTSMILDYFVNELKQDSLKEMIQDIHESSIRLIAMVNDFLDLSRLEQQKLEFKKEFVHLSDLANEVVTELAPTLHSGVTLAVSPAGDGLPVVKCDKDKIKEVLINLVGNAIKFTEQGSIQISFAIKDKFVETTVSDSGRGIPIANQALLFRKFQQAGESLLTRDTTKGTGLGLYISKLMIEGMGGSIWLARSEPEKGTAFSFTLPTV